MRKRHKMLPKLRHKLVFGNSPTAAYVQPLVDVDGNHEGFFMLFKAQSIQRFKRVITSLDSFNPVSVKQTHHMKIDDCIC